MVVRSPKCGEQIVIGHNITITVMSITGDQVKISIVDASESSDADAAQISPATPNFSTMESGPTSALAPPRTDESESDLTVRIPPWAFLRSCWLLLWNTIRHPFRTTVIDLMTGRVVGREE